MRRMIAFATLFLGLVVGVHPVRVVVGDEVATVEILLDGDRIVTLDSEPWTANCDFGQELAPRRLEAVAYDTDGHELARGLQLVNLPNAPAQVSVVVDGDAVSSVARLSWESKVGERPLSISAWFDGQPLTVNDPRAIVLPPHDDGLFHLFNAELEFPENVVSQVMVTFGGRFGEQVHSELTAIPVLSKSAGRRDPPAVSSLRGLFLKDGEPLEVVSVDEGRSEVIFVLGTTMNNLGDRLVRHGRDEARTVVPLRFDQAVRFLSPTPIESPGAATLFQLYPMSPEFRKDSGGLYWLLTRLKFRTGAESEDRIADAVAVAGLAAFERQHRRAVVLLAGSDMEDESRISALQSRRYLERLKVPFFVWTKKKKPVEIEGWGVPTSVSTLAALEDAFREVSRAVERQWIVWLEGRHLPQDVELSGRAKNLSLIP